MNKFKTYPEKLHSIRGKVLGKLVVLLAACMSLLWNEPLNGVVGSTSQQFVIVIDNINVNNINIDITNYCYCYWNEPLNGVVGSSRQFVILHSTFVPSFAESGRPPPPGEQTPYWVLIGNTPLPKWTFFASLVHWVSDHQSSMLIYIAVVIKTWNEFILSECWWHFFDCQY